MRDAWSWESSSSPRSPLSGLSNEGCDELLEVTLGVDQTYEASLKLSAERPAAEVSLEEVVVSKDAFPVVLLPGTVKVVIRDTRKRVKVVGVAVDRLRNRDGD